MAQLSIGEAKALVEIIAGETFAKMDPGIPCEKKEMSQSREETGSATTGLSKGLDSINAQFFFELLQNADSNNFGKAKAANQDPFVVFRLFRDRIVVDCNEDGFTELDLRALCSVASSTRTRAKAYIGNTGIGFKSVFKVAWKVWIQSGPFSFRVTHRKQASGMGMISPEWQETTEKLIDPLTRITLYLHNEDSVLDEVDQQLKHLRPEMLLFFSQLKRIEVHRFDGNGGDGIPEPSPTSSVTYCLSSPGIGDRVVVKSITVEEGQAPLCVDAGFLVAKTTATQLPRNENRQYRKDELEGQRYSTAGAVLAFPLSADLSPHIRPQEVFSFLPVKDVGFNFLLQSDFVTTANCDGLDAQSPRNRKLLSHLSGVFISTIQRMLGFTQLRYQWMRYLPSPEGRIWDPFAAYFIDALKPQLMEANILIPQAAIQPPSSMKRLRRLRGDMVDHSGSPLLDDLDGADAVYISQRYELDDLDLLEHYGLTKISTSQVVARMRADLRRPASKMRSWKADDELHVRVASWLLSILQQTTHQGDEIRSEIKALPLLPLQRGPWVSVGDGKVYLPTTSDGNKIPVEIAKRNHLEMIDLAATRHSIRKQLFIALGAIEASSRHIRTLILNQYGRIFPGIDLESDVSFVKFLYMTHSQADTAGTYGAIHLYDTSGVKRESFAHPLFFKDDTYEYSPGNLQLAVGFVHPSYLQFPPSRPGETTEPGSAWREWMHDFLGVRRFLRLTNRVPFLDAKESLAPEITSVAIHHPAEFIGVVRSLWRSNVERGFVNDHVRKQLREILVLCEDGTRSPLQNTILRLPALERLCSQYGVATEALPFLKASHPISDQDASGWQFLDQLGVTLDDGIRFYVHLLRAVSSRDPSVLTVQCLYAALRAKCADTTDSKMAQSIAADLTMLRRGFELEKLIYVPPTSRALKGVWLGVDECVWSTAVSCQGKIGLARYYDADLEDFFVRTLGVRKGSLNELYDELLGRDLESLTVVEAKRYIWAFNSLLWSEKLTANRPPEQLLAKRILPIKLPDGQKVLGAESLEFTVVDNTALHRPFRGWVKTLDFDMTQVHNLKPFLGWSGLEERCTTRMVAQVSQLGRGTKFPVSDPRFDIKRKSHALLRLAAHFGSPRVEKDARSFYDLLRSCRTWETDEISTQLRLKMGGVTITSEPEPGGALLFEDQSPSPEIYLPHDQERLDVCVQYTLPRLLLGWMMTGADTETSNRIGVIRAVLDAKPASVARVLELEGIIDVDVENQDADAVEEQCSPTSHPSLEQPRMPVASPAASMASSVTPMLSPLADVRPGTPPRRASPLKPAAQGVTQLPSTAVDVVLAMRRSPLSSGATSPGKLDPEFRTLLDHVIATARRREQLPPLSKLDWTPISSPRENDDNAKSSRSLFFPIPSRFLFFPPNRFTPDEIQAAGELYIFEFLCNIKPRLPGFTAYSWTSKLKKLVQSYNDYDLATVGSFSGDACFKYFDTDGVFTALLIEKGYLDSTLWEARKPMYLIDIKVTSRGITSSFPDDGSWYEKDGSWHKKAGLIAASTDTVNLLFRLHDIYSPNIGLELYVSPSQPGNKMADVP